VTETEWQGAPKDISKFVGFIYRIENKANGRFYIGQKKFWFKRKLKPLKGKKKFRHRIIESDWKSYYGSCMELLEDIRLYSKENFTRTILMCCTSKAWMNYYETKEQFDRNALLDSRSYNGIINCRISINQLV